MRATNKDNNSALKRLVPAVAMLALSAVTLSTSTYAWFTMNKSVEMTGLNMTAATGEGMEISLASVKGNAATGALKFLGDSENGFDGNHPADTDDELGWKNQVVVGSYYKDIGTLKPASSCDGVKLFNATDATNSGKDATKFEQITLGSSSMAQIQQQENLATANDLTATGTSGYYVDIPVHLRTSKVKTADNASGNIYYKMIINNKTSNANEPLYKAVRVAFINGVKDTTTAAAKILTCDELNAYYKPGTAGTAVNSTSGRGEVTNLSKTSVTSDVTFPTNDAGADSGLDIPYAENSGEYGHLDFTIRVWLEGESTSCYDANAGQQWNIGLMFSMGEFETSTPAAGG